MSLNKNVVIAALARDCDKSLIRNIPRIERLREEFVWSHVVVIENDSKDNTKKLLNNWSNQSDGVKIISNDFGTVTIPEMNSETPSPNTSLYRIEKMVRYRNMYMDYIRTIRHTIDYLIIIDIDIEDFSTGGIVKSILNIKADWGGIFANGITKKEFTGKVFSRIFYDIFALQEYPLIDKIGYTPESLSLKQKTIGKTINKNEYTSIVSAFGGVGIYKYDIVKNFKYCVVHNSINENEALCEHIPFNLEVVKMGYKNYISKELHVLYGTHSFGSIISTLLPHKIFKFIYKFYKMNFKD